MILKDSDLENVYGGLTDAEIINKINSLYTYVPESIRNEIIRCLNKCGRKATIALIQKYNTAEFVWAKEMLDLFI